MLNAVLQYVKGVVNGLDVPLQSQPLTAQVVPPPVEPLNGAMAWITPGRMKGGRQTMPRGPGFMGLDWPVSVTMDLLALPTDPNLEQVFYVAADAVLLALLTTVMPLQITDPTTEATSQVTAVGEETSYTPGNWVTTANGRAILLRGEVTTTIREKLQTGRYQPGSG